MLFNKQQLALLGMFPDTSRSTFTEATEGYGPARVNVDLGVLDFTSASNLLPELTTADTVHLDELTFKSGIDIGVTAIEVPSHVILPGVTIRSGSVTDADLTRAKSINFEPLTFSAADTLDAVPKEGVSSTPSSGGGRGSTGINQAMNTTRIGVRRNTCSVDFTLEEGYLYNEHIFLDENGDAIEWLSDDIAAEKILFEHLIKMYPVDEGVEIDREGVLFELISGKLPPGVYLNKMGVLYGKPQELDCQEECKDLAPSFSWFYEDEDGWHSYAKSYSFRVRATYTGLSKETDLIIQVANNWNLDKEKFLPFKDVPVIAKKVEPEPSLPVLPKSLCCIEDAIVNNERVIEGIDEMESNPYINKFINKLIETDSKYAILIPTSNEIVVPVVEFKVVERNENDLDSIILSSLPTNVPDKIV